MAHPAVSIGFLLPTREMVMTQSRPELRPILDLAERAEALGFDSLWAGDSILARPRFEALTTLAAVAARTQRVKLGTAAGPLCWPGRALRGLAQGVHCCRGTDAGAALWQS